MNDTTESFIVERLTGREGLTVEPYPNDPSAYQAKGDQIVLVQFTDRDYAARTDSFDLHLMVRAKSTGGQTYHNLLTTLSDYIHERLQYYSTAAYSCAVFDSRLEGYSENTGMWVMTLAVGVKNYNL